MTCNECYHCEICKRYPGRADDCVYAIEKTKVEEVLSEHTVVNQYGENNYSIQNCGVLNL